jgi:hypothetical protein
MEPAAEHFKPSFAELLRYFGGRAARLQALATPGMVYVSQSIYDQTRSQPDLFFVDRGKHRVKNIAYPIHVFEVAFDPVREPLLAHPFRSPSLSGNGADQRQHGRMRFRLLSRCVERS